MPASTPSNPARFTGRWLFIGPKRARAIDVAKLTIGPDGWSGAIVQVEYQRNGGLRARNGRTVSKLAEEISMLRAAGLRVAMWMWIEAGPACAASVRSRLAELAPAWAAGPPDFVCLNIELGGGWDETRKGAQREWLVGVWSALADTHPGVPITVSSHGGCPRCAWQGLPVTASMGQYYDKDGSTEGELFDEWSATWKREFPDAQLFPVLGCNSTPPRIMELLAANLPRIGAEAVAYFSLAGLRSMPARVPIASSAPLVTPKDDSPRRPMEGDPGPHGGVVS